MKPTLFSAVFLGACLAVATAQTDAAEPTLTHVGDKGELACFTLTNPTEELLFVLASCTRVMKGPTTVNGPGWTVMPTPWHVAANLNEGVVIPLPPRSSLNLRCELPPGRAQWRAIAYVLRHLSDEDAAFTPSAEVSPSKNAERNPRLFREASNRVGDMGDT
jgi:hypothetical protein